jgi:hypothetical protein
MEKLTNEEEDLIFETKLELFSIGTINVLDETISLLNIGMLEVRISGESDQEQ